MNAEGGLEGGCLCGLVRYQVSQRPFTVEYCHCRMCQKVAGAPFANWMDFRTEQVTWLTGEPTEYESSDAGRRGFCATCGSTLSFRSLEYPEYLSLSLASLDEPNLVRPTRHIYVESQMNWLELNDGGKRFAQGAGVDS